SDLGDRTIVRGIASGSEQPRRRRRRTAPITAATGSSLNTATAAPPSKRMQAFAWVLVVVAVLVIGLAATATYFLIKTNSPSIPTVTDIAAIQQGETVSFTWPDPGLQPGDSYQIETSDGETSMQRSASFALDGEP